MADRDQDLQQRLLTVVREWLVENESDLPPEALKLAQDLNVLAKYGTAWDQVYRSNVAPESVVMFYVLNIVREGLVHAMEQLASENLQDAG